MEPRRWRDVRICGRTVWLYHRPREIRCPPHSRHIEEVPWAAPSARFSYYRVEYLISHRISPCSPTDGGTEGLIEGLDLAYAASATAS